MLKEVEEEKKNSIKKLVNVCQESYISQNDVALLNYMKTLNDISEINYAIFVDSTNRVLIHSDMRYMGRILTDKVSTNALKYSKPLIQNYYGSSGEEISEISSPVVIGNKKIGACRIGYDQKRIKARIENSLKESGRRLGVVGGGVMVIGILGALVLAGTLTRPIRVLAYGAKKIGEGKLDYQIPIKRKDELGNLSNEFNLMAKKLAELDQMKTDFVSSVSHELRSPLGAITGYVDSMLGGLAGVVPDQLKEYLVIIRKNALRLKGFIDDILDLAKLEAGLFDVNPKDTAFSEIIRDVTTLFQPNADKLRISLLTRLDPETVSGKVDGDRVRQVFTNLLSNALKFTPEGGRITMGAEERKNEVLCSVADSGVGIPEDSLSEVFSKFKQVKGQKSVRKTKGTGLGLSIAKGIVESHGGKIWVESKVGVGTTFKFILPRT